MTLAWSTACKDWERRIIAGEIGEMKGEQCKNRCRNVIYAGMIVLTAL